MLPAAIIKEIDRLLKEGELSQRKIAVRLGVGRATVAEIAKGQRALHGRERLRRNSDEGPMTAPTRCPRCGYHVCLPCRICRARRYRHSQMLLDLLARSNEKSRGRTYASKKFVRKDEQVARFVGYLRAS
jgi:transcriptional regulator with XRE-family HTH domain